MAIETNKFLKKSVEEKAEIKATAIAKLNFGEYTDTTYGVRVEIQSIKDIGGGIEIMARAWRGGKQLGFGKDGSVDVERFLIWNPPILVDDPNGNIVRQWTDSEGSHTRVLKEDPIKAVRETLAHTIKVSGRTDGNIVRGKVGSTTSTFFPAAGANEPVDGRAKRAGVDETFGTIRGGAGTASEDASGSIAGGRIISSTTTDQYDELERGIHLYGISSIGTDNVDSSTMSFMPSFIADSLSGATADGSRVVLVASTPASTSSVANGDYGQLGGTSFGESQTQTNLSVDTYEDITVNSSGITHLETARDGDDIAKFGYLYKWDFGNTTTGITWSSAVAQAVLAYAADTAGTTKDPKLVIVHSVPGIASLRQLIGHGQGTR